jgi:hypothetical protein
MKVREGAAVVLLCGAVVLRVPEARGLTLDELDAWRALATALRTGGEFRCADGATEVRLGCR